MKKENVVGKILVYSLSGFVIGIALLIVSYISIYFIAGINVYYTEISIFQDIHILIPQMLIAGFAYYIVFIVLNIYLHISNKDVTEKYMTKHPYKTVLICLLSCIGLFSAIFLIGSKNIYTENIAKMNITILVTIIAICYIIIMVKCEIEKKLIKEINPKIQERNK